MSKELVMVMLPTKSIGKKGNFLLNGMRKYNFVLKKAMDPYTRIKFKYASIGGFFLCFDIRVLLSYSGWSPG